MVRRIACLIVVVFCSTGAQACLNDEEAPSHEREFRSAYLKSLDPLTPYTEEDDGRFVHEGWLYGGGAAMVLSALAFSAGRERALGRRKPCDDGQGLS